MEKETVAITSALAGATMTAAIALVIRRLEKAKDHQACAALVLSADQEGYRRGWSHGNNKALRESTGEREVFSEG